MSASIAATACATCRRFLGLGEAHLLCSVAACNSGRVPLRFCSRKCWDAHVPIARHRRASFIEVASEALTEAAPPLLGK